jgi:hypothetical protein
MNHMLLLQELGLLGLRIRYWIAIIVVIAIVVAILIWARSRSR